MEFSYFRAIFSCFLRAISRKTLKVRFRGYKLSRTTKKFAKSRKFLPAKLSTFKVVEYASLELIFVRVVENENNIDLYFSGNILYYK